MHPNRPELTRLVNINQVRYLMAEYKGRDEISDIPCQRLGFAISDIKMSLGNEIPMTNNRCGENDLICVNCVGYLKDLEETKYETNIDIGDEIDIDTSDETGDKKQSGLWNAIKNYSSTPLGKTIVTVLGVGAALGAAYGAYSLIAENEGEISHSTRDISSNQTEHNAANTSASQTPLFTENNQSSLESSTNTSTTNHGYAKTLKIHHKKSMFEAVQALNEHPDQRVDVLFELKPGCTNHELLNCVFDSNTDNTDLSHAGKIKWASHSKSSPACIASLNKSEFQNALACSVIKSDSLQRMSVETLTLPNTKRKLQQEAAINKVEAQLNKVIRSVDGTTDVTCRALENSDTVDVFDIKGNSAVEMKQTECRPTVTKHQPRSLNSEHAKISKDLCIDEIILISEGIPDSSDVAGTVQQTISFDNPVSVNHEHISSVKVENGAKPLDRENNPLENAAENYVRSALRRCPDLKITDVRVATKVEGEQSNSPSISVLPQQKVVQALDHILKEGLAGHDNRIVIIESNEVTDYDPTSTLPAALAMQINTLEGNVMHISGSSSAWLTNTDNIHSTSSVSETLIAKPRSANVSYSFLAPIVSAISLFGLGISSLYKFTFKNKKEKENKNSEEMQVMNPQNNGINSSEIQEDVELERMPILENNPQQNNGSHEIPRKQTKSQLNEMLESLDDIGLEEENLLIIPRTSRARLINSAHRLKDPWEPYPIRDGIIRSRTRQTNGNNNENENTRSEQAGYEDNTTG